MVCSSRNKIELLEHNSHYKNYKGSLKYSITYASGVNYTIQFVTYRNSTIFLHSVKVRSHCFFFRHTQNKRPNFETTINNINKFYIIN